MQTKTREAHESIWEENISAWADGEGELRSEDLDTPYGRQVWDTYHLIGDVMRNKDLALQPSALFYARLSKVIDSEPAIVAPKRSLSAARLGWSGLVVAAAIASVVWVLVPMLSTAPERPTQLGAPVMAAADETGLVDYVDAHRQFAGVNPVRQVSWQSGGSGR